MDWVPIFVGAVTLMLLLFFTGLPVFITFLVINVTGMFWLMGTSGFGMFANSIFQSVTSGSLVAVPLFILMGEILFRSGSIDVLVESVNKIFGHHCGKDYTIITALSMIFGALCGSTVAVAVLLGRSIMPSMQGRGYDSGLTSGAILGGATLAAIIPPSLVVIVLGSQVEVSIASLLVAGIVPGILLALLMLVYTYIRIILNPALEPVVDVSAIIAHKKSEKLFALIRMSPFFLVIFFVIGLILMGITTPSESAATGVIGALLTSVIFKKLSWEMFREALFSTVKTTTMILIILAGSKLFGQLLSFIGASSGLLKAVTILNLPSDLLFIVLMAVPFFLCMFIDAIAIMLVAIPIYLPMVKLYGFDPIWFWMLFIINLSVGAITPPFGYTLFALKAAAPTVSFKSIYSGVWPIVIVFLIGMTLMFFIPSLITIVPHYLQ